MYLFQLGKGNGGDTMYSFYNPEPGSGLILALVFIASVVMIRQAKSVVMLSPMYMQVSSHSLI